MAQCGRSSQVRYPILRNPKISEFPVLQQSNVALRTESIRTGADEWMNGLQTELETMLSILVVRKLILAALTAPTLPKNADAIRRYNKYSCEDSTLITKWSNIDSPSPSPKLQPRLLRSTSSMMAALNDSSFNESVTGTQNVSFHGLGNDTVPNKEDREVTKSTRRKSKRLQCVGIVPYNDVLEPEERDGKAVGPFQEFVQKYCCKVDSYIRENLYGFVKTHNTDFLKISGDQANIVNDLRARKCRKTLELSQQIQTSSLPNLMDDISLRGMDRCSSKDSKLLEADEGHCHENDTKVLHNSGERLDNDGTVTTAILKMLTDLHHENAGQLSTFCKIAEVECARTTVLKDLEVADKNVIEAYRRKQFLKNAKNPIPEIEAGAVINALKIRNLVLDKLASLVPEFGPE